ncbi:TPA: hypothetical protein ACKRQV_000076 [Pseudomonas aeruginosa]
MQPIRSATTGLEIGFLRVTVTPPANSGDQVKCEADSGGDATQDVKQRDDLGHSNVSSGVRLWIQDVGICWQGSR